jgi:hypothetical protein
MPTEVEKPPNLGADGIGFIICLALTLGLMGAVSSKTVASRKLSEWAVSACRLLSARASLRLFPHAPSLLPTTCRTL